MAHYLITGGSGVVTSINELAAHIQRITGSTASIPRRGPTARRGVL